MEKQSWTSENLFDDLEALEPKPIRDFVPANGDEQKELFLAGKVRNPNHQYARLDSLDFYGTDRSLRYIRQTFIDDPTMNPKHLDAYIGLAGNFILKNELMKLAQLFNSNQGAIKYAAGRLFSEINSELYGEPEKGTYDTLLIEASQKIKNLDLCDAAQAISDELLVMFPQVEKVSERFIPSQTTVEQAARTANVFYKGMLSHVPDRDERFSPEEIVGVFNSIIREEFGASAAEWKAELYDSTSINVIASEKLVKVPENRKPVSSAELRKLVVHEIGVHMLRSVMGQSLDVKPLRLGLADYGDSEEGLAKVIEQAIDSKFQDSGVPYYIAAGLAHFGGKDFRDCFEFMWRYNLLTKAKIATEEEKLQTDIEKAKDTAYRQAFRLFRGTDEMPFFKDLSYYNGAMKMWQYMENFGADVNTLLLAYMGKADPMIDDHRHILLETKTVVE